MGWREVRQRGEKCTQGQKQREMGVLTTQSNKIR